jgi:hypothetical protein
MTEPEESHYAIRVGIGLLANTPMSAERRAAFDREEEKERLQAEREAQQRAEAAAEHRAGLLWQGVAPRSVSEVLVAASFAQDRADRREERIEREADAILANPPPRQWVTALAAAKAEREAREAAAEVTPASEAGVDRKIKRLANAVWNATGHKPEIPGL